jgi:hypothetical protein
MPLETVRSFHPNESPVSVPGAFNTGFGYYAEAAVRLPDSILLGSCEFLKPIVYVNPGLPAIGGAALDHFAVTIDIKNRQVRFARPDRTPIDPAPSIRHQGFYYKTNKNDWVVTGPIEGAGLDHLGLKVNDQVTAVNGMAVYTLPWENMQHLVDTTDTLHLDIIRDGQQMRVDVPVAIVVP